MPLPQCLRQRSSSPFFWCGPGLLVVLWIGQTRTISMKTRSVLTTATWLSLSLALVALPFSSSQAQRFSDKYDQSIQSAVKQHWPDYREWQKWKAQLYQESRLDPDAVSPVGAAGLAQFMPGTWSDVVRDMRWDGRPSPFSPRMAIMAGAYYQGKLRRTWWPTGRTAADRNDLGAASYNAGLGNILKAQRLCGNAVLWKDIYPCLPDVTGRHSEETITYVERIHRWHEELRRPR